MSTEVDSPLNAFLARARNSARGPIEWDSAPARYKHYPEAQRVVLPWGERRGECPVGDLLLELCGVTRLIWTPVVDDDGVRVPGALKVRHGRSAPSGGALYPVETYIAVGGRDPRAGLYHYDPAHHCLELLRPGDHRGALTADSARTLPGAVVVLSTRFWRNGFKYGEFGYRLQTQEIGVLAAQLEALDAYAEARLRFDDRAVHALLGLDPRAESVMAVMCVGEDATASAPPAYPELISVPCARESDCAPVVSDRLPAAAALHAATMTAPGEPASPPEPYPMETGPEIALPGTPVALEAGIPGRSSPADGFRPQPIDAGRFAGVLGAVADGWTGFDRGAALYCVVVRVDEIPSGVYRYDQIRHTLVSITDAVDDSVRYHPVVGEAAAILLPVGDFFAGTAAFGARWYRILQADVGIALQRAGLAAAAQGLAARIYSGETPDFTAPLGCPGPRTALSAVLLGTPRGASTLEQRVCS